MEKTYIFLRRVCDLTAQVAGSNYINGAEKLPFYNDGSIGSCGTETICLDITNIPTCRVETSTIYKNSDNSDDNFRLSTKLREMRLQYNMTAAELSRRTGVHSATISRYENNNFSIDKIDINTLSKLSISCGKHENYLLTPFLLFKKYHKEILQNYIRQHHLSKKELATMCNVSYTLVKTWFNKEKRSPSYNVWQTTFKDFSSDWIKHNID